MRAVLACALLVSGLLLAGCGSIGTAPAADRITPGSLVVLVPAEQDDPGLKPGEALLLSQLHRRLEAAGLRVAALDAANHGLPWRQEADAGGGDSMRFRATTRGLSVELMGIGTEGGSAFRGFGSASLPYRVDVGAGQMELRADLFDEDDEIADGVRLALAPLLERR